jgi:hypothetical protein
VDDDAAWIFYFAIEVNDAVCLDLTDQPPRVRLPRQQQAVALAPE